MIQPPKLSYIERKKMKLAREMQLETMRQEDEKTSVVEQKIESTLQ
jgi:hypothetical protein